MKKQPNGIDLFELRWQQCEEVLKPNDRFVESSFVFVKEKAPDEPLNDFLWQAKKTGYWTFPKYFLNGDDFTFWYNLNICRRRMLDTPGFFFNTLAWMHHNERRVGIIEFQIRRMLGETFTLDTLNDLGLNGDYWREHLEEENTSVQLYCCCICGNKGCGDFLIETKRDGNIIVWHFIGQLLRDFRFDYEQYKSQFDEYRAFVKEHGIIWSKAGPTKNS